MNPELPGQILSFAFTTGAWFLAICYFGIPVARAYWRASEDRDKEATEEALSRTKPSNDTSHIWDAT